MTIADVFTYPQSLTMLTTMELPLGFLAPLGDGVTIASVESTLFDLNTQEAVELTDDPTWTGATITQWVRGPSQLVAGHGFRLTVTYTDSTGQVNAGVLTISVPIPTP